MTKHDAKSHGRYTCPLRCPAGAPLSSDQTNCLCGPCWEGKTCQAPKCAHGEIVGCPNHGTHCHHSERVCLCPVGPSGNPSYTGKHCEHKFDPAAVMTAEEARRVADADVQRENEKREMERLVEEKPCGDLQCDGLSMMNTTSCQCQCTPPWEGATCDVCPDCLSSIHTPNHDDNCQCMCADRNLTCQNEGYINEQTCSCNCVNHFSGKDCSECSPIKCENGGEFNDELCSCLCPKGWKGKTCSECDETTTCENGGALNVDTCECSCNQEAKKKNMTTFWKGDFCEVSVYFCLVVPLFLCSFVPLFESNFLTPPLPLLSTNRRALPPTLSIVEILSLTNQHVNVLINVNQLIASTTPRQILSLANVNATVVSTSQT